MKVTIDTTNKTFEVCTKGESIDFNNLIIELQKTIERCKNTITINNTLSSTGIPIPCKTTTTHIPLNQYPLEQNSEFKKTTSVRNNF